MPMTAHFIGGCAIGTPRERRGRPLPARLRLPGLHVADGSAISANLGVNPSLTITAQAERAMSFWPNKGEADPRPIGRRTSASPGAPTRWSRVRSRGAWLPIVSVQLGMRWLIVSRQPGRAASAERMLGDRRARSAIVGVPRRICERSASRVVVDPYERVLTARPRRQVGVRTADLAL